MERRRAPRDFALALTRGRTADLESVFYVLAELVMGEQLPWSCKDEKSKSDSDDVDESEQFNASFKRAHPRTCSQCRLPAIDLVLVPRRAASRALQLRHERAAVPAPAGAADDVGHDPGAAVRRGARL